MEILVALGILAVLVVCSRAVLADEPWPKSWILRRLLATTAFAATALCLVGFSILLTAGIAGMGRNSVELERGERIAHFGVPFRFATSQLDPSDTGLSRTPRLGSDAPWNPWEIPTDFEEEPFRRSLSVIFALLSLYTLLPWALVADARAGGNAPSGPARRYVRGRPPRPSARPS